MLLEVGIIALSVLFLIVYVKPAVAFLKEQVPEELFTALQYTFGVCLLFGVVVKLFFMESTPSFFTHPMGFLVSLALVLLLWECAIFALCLFLLIMNKALHP